MQLENSPKNPKTLEAFKFLKQEQPLSSNYLVQLESYKNNKNVGSFKKNLIQAVGACLVFATIILVGKHLVNTAYFSKTSKLDIENITHCNILPNPNEQLRGVLMRSSKYLRHFIGHVKDDPKFILTKEGLAALAEESTHFLATSVIPLMDAMREVRR